jgi:uncharacterized protein YndB with AHSA1/START domain
VKLVAQELIIAAPMDVVYRLLTDPAEFVRWMAEEATLDPRPGGVVRWTHANGDTCRGEFVELVPGRRVVFSYGWEREEVGVPPGSTTVEIDLDPTADGGTRLRLVHRGLDGPMAGAHDGGWRHYLDRLRLLAVGGDPGPDPFASIRVPTRAELGDASATADGDPFAELAEPLLASATATRSTMMGLPCLRRAGAFFAGWDRHTGALLVKLSRARVDELLGSGATEPFAPAGRRFQQWAAIPPHRVNSWPGLLDEAMRFVDGSAAGRPPDLRVDRQREDVAADP